MILPHVWWVSYKLSDNRENSVQNSIKYSYAIIKQNKYKIQHNLSVEYN